MRVGSRNESKLEGVRTDALLFGEPDGECSSCESARRGTEHIVVLSRRSGLALGHFRHEQLFELAELVRRSDHVGEAIAAFGISLVLHDFDDGFERDSLTSHLGFFLD